MIKIREEVTVCRYLKCRSFIFYFISNKYFIETGQMTGTINFF